MRRLITDFRRGDLSGRCRYPLRLEKVPQISQIYTDLLWDFFFSHADFADDADFFHRMTRNLFEGFLLRRLITDFRGGDLSGRCRYPLRLEKVPQISQIYTDFSWDFFFSHADFADDADFFIHRMTRNLFGGFPAEAITHGFSRRRPIRSVQIPTESGQRDSTEIP